MGCLNIAASLLTLTSSLFPWLHYKPVPSLTPRGPVRGYFILALYDLGVGSAPAGRLTIEGLNRDLQSINSTNGEMTFIRFIVSNVRRRYKSRPAADSLPRSGPQNNGLLRPAE